MKVEVINCSTKVTIETYSVANLDLIGFQGWEKISKDAIHLTHLENVVKNVQLKDPETRDPISFPKEVELYLPDPLKDRVFFRLAKSIKDMDESSHQFKDTLEDVTEQASTPDLKLTTVLSAVVTEILQNHQPHTDYEVRISE